MKFFHPLIETFSVRKGGEDSTETIKNTFGFRFAKIPEITYFNLARYLIGKKKKTRKTRRKICNSREKTIAFYVPTVLSNWCSSLKGGDFGGTRVADLNIQHHFWYLLFAS